MRTLGRHTRIAMAAALAACAVALACAATASAADVTDLLPAVSPPGANDFTCKPTAAHPAPVVLVHGTFEGAADNWATASPKFKAAGYCVFALEYGDRGTGDIAASAGQLQRFVDAVLAATGARKVSMVGHSQGGMMPRYYLKFLGGASKVHTLVGLSPSNHGTTLDGLGLLAAFFPGATGLLCPACEEQIVGSAFLNELNSGGDTVPGVEYTVIQTRFDQVVTPYASAFLSGSNVKNVLLQNQCILDLGDHLSMPYDHIADADVLTALDPLHPRHPLCTPILPTEGG